MAAFMESRSAAPFEFPSSPAALGWGGGLGGPVRGVLMPLELRPDGLGGGRGGDEAFKICCAGECAT